jgi:hypothetical protein
LGDPIIESGTASIVTIAPGDRGFSTSACGAWVKIG